MRFIVSLLLAAFLPAAIFAQPSFITSLYAPQHGLNVPVDAELRVSLQAPLDPASLSDSAIYVWSDITGLHKLVVTLENGNRDLRIVPRHWRLNNRPPFNAGERVTVTLTTRLRYADSRQFEGFTWHYTVAVRQNRGGDFKPEALFGGVLSTNFIVSDFNGDGWRDVAIQVKERKTNKFGIAVFHGRNHQSFQTRVLVLGAGSSIGRGGDDLHWAEVWSVATRMNAYREIKEPVLPKLSGDVMKIERRQGRSGFIFWNGKNYIWYELSK